MSPHNDQFKPFNIPNPRKMLQKENSTIKSIPESAKPTSSSSVLYAGSKAPGAHPPPTNRTAKRALAASAAEAPTRRERRAHQPWRMRAPAASAVPPGGTSASTATKL